MTKIGKGLVVFVVGASFAFLGFAWVSMMGGPNWNAEAAALPGYSIEKGEGPDGKWTVTDRVTGENVAVKSPTVQASAVVAAREHLEKKQQAEIASLGKQTSEYKAKLAAARKLNEADVKALEARVKVLIGQLDELNKKILTMSQDVVKRSQETQAIRAEAAKRREDVFRLTRELEEIRTDNYRSDALQKKLNDYLVQLKLVLSNLESRNQQLREQLSGMEPH